MKNKSKGSLKTLVKNRWVILGLIVSVLAVLGVYLSATASPHLASYQGMYDRGEYELLNEELTQELGKNADWHAGRELLIKLEITRGNYSAALEHILILNAADNNPGRISQWLTPEEILDRVGDVFAPESLTEKPEYYRDLLQVLIQHEGQDYQPLDVDSYSVAKSKLLAVTHLGADTGDAFQWIKPKAILAVLEQWITNLSADDPDLQAAVDAGLDYLKADPEYVVLTAQLRAFTDKTNQPLKPLYTAKLNSEANPKLLSPTGDGFIYSLEGNKFYWLNVPTQNSYLLGQYEHGLRDCVWTPDGNRLAFGELVDAGNKHKNYINVFTGGVLEQRHEFPKAIEGLHLKGWVDNETLVFVHLDILYKGMLKSWNVRTGEFKDLGRLGYGQWVTISNQGSLVWINGGEACESLEYDGRHFDCEMTSTTKPENWLQGDWVEIHTDISFGLFDLETGLCWAPDLNFAPKAWLDDTRMLGLYRNKIIVANLDTGKWTWTGITANYFYFSYHSTGNAVFTFEEGILMVYVIN